MKVTPEEYNSLLYKLKDPNEFVHFLRIPAEEPIYTINLATRTIDAPEVLSVEKDHNSEIIWFQVDRFYDDFDLYSANCWIVYRNAERGEHYYSAPLIIGGREGMSNDVVLIPWALSEYVTKKAGSIEFAFEFFKISEDGKRFMFRLNTSPSKSKILYGLPADPLKALTQGGTDG